MADIQSAMAEIRRGKKKNKKSQDENIMVCPILPSSVEHLSEEGRRRKDETKTHNADDVNFLFVLS